MMATISNDTLSVTIGEKAVGGSTTIPEGVWRVDISMASSNTGSASEVDINGERVYRRTHDTDPVVYNLTATMVEGDTIAVDDWAFAHISGWRVDE